jgi:hypothetical protein
LKGKELNIFLAKSIARGGKPCKRKKRKSKRRKNIPSRF